MGHDLIPAPPAFTSTEDYAAKLGRLAFWQPYVVAVLEQHGLDTNELQAGFPGTYPAVMCGGVVVKLFGYFGAWSRSYSAELTATRAVTDDSTVVAPAVLAAGSLYPQQAEPWTYLVLERMKGRAWRDVAMTHPSRQRIAGALGDQLQRTHRSLVDPEALHPDWLTAAGHAEATIARHQQWRTLPTRLIDQLEDYLRDYRPQQRCLVHADVTADHVFVEAEQLSGLIDWADAMITDPYYELAALHLNTFHADRSLLSAFLDAYGWPTDRGFARRAMQTALMHRFNVLSDVADQAVHADTLDHLAEQLWG